MTYPQKPDGNASLDQFDKDGVEYNFADSDNQKLPMDDNLFLNGYKNASESEDDATPSAHEHNWLFNLFYKNIRYCIGTSEENKSIIADHSPRLKTVEDELKTKAQQSDVLKLQTDIVTKVNKNLNDATPAQSFIDKTIGWVIPDYENGIQLSAKTDYTMDYAGIICWKADFAKALDKTSAVGNNTTHNLTINGVVVLSSRYKWSTYTKYYTEYTQTISVKRGDVINFTRGVAVFYPCK